MYNPQIQLETSRLVFFQQLLESPSPFKSLCEMKIASGHGDSFPNDGCTVVAQLPVQDTTEVILRAQVPGLYSLWTL